MSLEIVGILALLLGVAIAVRTGRLPADLAAFLALAVLLVAGIVPTRDLFLGFSSPPFLAILALSMVGSALLRSGLGAAAGRELRRRLRGRGEGVAIAGVTLGGAVVGAVLGPQLATAALMPAIASIARDGQRSQSRLLLPLATGSVVGAACTGYGTSANVVAATVAVGEVAPLGPLTFAIGGVTVLAVTVAFLVTAGRRFLPTHGSATGADGTEDLARVYLLHEHVFSVQVSPGSALVGRTLGESDLGALDVQVVAVQRGDGERASALPDTEIREGDILLLRAQLDDLRRLIRVRGVDVRETRAADLPRPLPGSSAARARLVAGSTLVGRTLRTLNFRERFGVTIVGIERAGKILRSHLSDTCLEVGDEILVLGERSRLERFAQFPQWKVIDTGLGALRRLQDHLYLMRIHEDSALAGVTLGDSGVGELVGLTVGGIIRDGATHLGPGPEEVLEVGDRLLVTGEPWRIVKLLEFGQVVSEATAVDSGPLSPHDVQVSELAVAPRSGAAGHTVPELDFRHRYGLEVLGIWRGGRPLEASLGRIVLRFGDALLVQGPRDRLDAVADDPDFVVMDAAARPRPRRRRTWTALAALGVLLVLSVGGLQPLHVAAAAAAVVVVLGGAVRMEEAYRGTEWRTAFSTAAFVPVAVAAERVGATGLVADALARVASGAGPSVALVLVGLIAAVLAIGLDGAPAVLLLVPVIARLAEVAGLSPVPLTLAAALSASAAMIVGIRHPAFVLVTGAGGYRRRDFVRVGLPVTVVVLAVAALLLPLVFPF